MPRSYASDKTTGDGITYRWCHVCDLWKVKDEGNFQRVKTRNGWSRMCKPCRADHYNPRRRPDLEVSGRRVPIMKYRHHLQWMIGVVGWCKTCDRLGISSTMLSRWMGRGKTPQGHPPTQIQKKSAVRIIRAAAELREDISIGTVKLKEVHLSKDVCKGCGGDMDAETDGCAQCWDRRRGRERRKGDKYREYEHQRYLRRAAASSAA